MSQCPQFCLTLILLGAIDDRTIFKDSEGTVFQITDLSQTIICDSRLRLQLFFLYLDLIEIKKKFSTHKKPLPLKKIFVYLQVVNFSTGGPYYSPVSKKLVFLFATPMKYFDEKFLSNAVKGKKR